MSASVRTALMSNLPQLRHEPTAKRIRASVGGRTVVDSTSALLVWEPRRVVASWAVPEKDVSAELLAGAAPTATGDDVGSPMPDVSRRPVLDPSVPFLAHTTEGTVLDLRAGADHRAGAAFRPDDPDLAGYVLLDFAAFDGWWEEDAPAMGHPRDPFHRIDILPSSRPLRLERDGVLLAESEGPTLLFETLLPTRFYLPREAVVVDLTPSATTSICAYKGRASYFSATVGGREIRDIAWTYEDPLPEAAAVGGLVAFFDERVDVVLDGDRRPRPVTPWSRGPD
ncbi:MAG: hypothetical protein JWO98_3962 [Frankiales bacterium]|nr:hypothetical protein [Frankiales bacterium]